MPMRGRAAAAGLALILAGCSAGKDLAAAQQAVTTFHQQMNAAAFDAIYDASSADWQKATARAASAQFLGAVHTKLGNFVSGNTVGWAENVNTNGTFMTLNYQSKYAGGDAAEHFLYRIDGGKLQLVGYNINSNALILK